MTFKKISDFIFLNSYTQTLYKFNVCNLFCLLMWILLYYSESFQLHCRPQMIVIHIGETFVILCQYDTSHFLFSKKYWCQGESKVTCTILVDSDNLIRSKTGRVQIIDLGPRGLFVKVTDLQFEDTGQYWVGIDKIHADVMTPVKVVVTEGKNKASHIRMILHLGKKIKDDVSLWQFQCLNPEFGPWPLWQTVQRAADSQWLSAAGVWRERLSSTAGIRRASCCISRLIYRYTVASCFRTAIFTVLPRIV